MTFEVKIKRIKYPQKENGWGVFMTDHGKVVGIIDWKVREGDEVTLIGRRERSKFDGRMEIIIEHAKPKIDLNPRALLDYCCSITKGFGESKADEIWQTYGTSWRDDPDLTFIGGLSSKARSEWTQTLEQLDERIHEAQAAAWLMERGLTIKFAMSAYAMWGKDTIAKVQADPYILANLPGRGFVEVDALRGRFGIGDDDPRRLEAALLYCLGKATQGDTAAETRELIGQACLVVPFGEGEAMDALWRLQERCEVRMLNGHVTRRALWEAEQAIAGYMGVGEPRMNTNEHE